MNDKDVVINTLEGLLSGDIPNNYGICRILQGYVRVKYRYILQEWLRESFKSWEHFSGSVIYPIPITTSLIVIRLSEMVVTVTTLEQYQYSKRRGLLWKGKQLKYRLSLVQHLLMNINKLDLSVDNELKQSKLTRNKSTRIGYKSL